MRVDASGGASSALHTLSLRGALFGFFPSHFIFLKNTLTRPLSVLPCTPSRSCLCEQLGDVCVAARTSPNSWCLEVFCVISLPFMLLHPGSRAVARVVLQLQQWHLEEVTLLPVVRS